MVHEPPVTLSVAHSSSVAFTALCAVGFLIAAGFAVHRAARRDMLLACATLAGVAACLLEPLLDFLGLCWYARDNFAVVFIAFGVSIPLAALVGYGFLFGAEAYIGAVMMRRGVKASKLWALYAFAWTLDFVLEVLGIHVRFYTYYGPQPFSVFSVPLWFMFVNAAFPIVAGAVFYLYWNRLRGAGVLLAIPLLPCIFGALYLGTAWPIFVALHTEVPGIVIWAAATATIAMSLALVRAIIRAIATANEGRQAGEVMAADITSTPAASEAKLKPAST